MRYKICFEFSGIDFFGSQKQPDKRTVQGEIEKALSILNRTLIKNKTENISIILSGRTDRGVSAKHQTAHFDTDTKINNPKRFLYSLNSILPDDIKVFEMMEVNDDFHAQKSAKYKHYRYTIQNNRVASVFCKDNLFFPYNKIDIERMNEALAAIVGCHEFGSFKSKSSNPYDDCTIYFAKAKRVEIERLGFIFIDIVGDRFLYNMVRSIVGVLIYIERNNLKPSVMKEILDKNDRRFGAEVVEAKGLCLEYVGYDEAQTYIKNKFIKEGLYNENI